MKLFKMTVERRREAREIVVHAESEEDAVGHALKRYAGWNISQCNEVLGEAHFTIALFPDQEARPAVPPAGLATPFCRQVIVRGGTAPTNKLIHGSNRKRCLAPHRIRLASLTVRP